MFPCSFLLILLSEITLFIPFPSYRLFCMFGSHSHTCVCIHISSRLTWERWPWEMKIQAKRFPSSPWERGIWRATWQPSNILRAAAKNSLLDTRWCPEVSSHLNYSVVLGFCKICSASHPLEVGQDVMSKKWMKASLSQTSEKNYVIYRRLSHYLNKGHYQWIGETPIRNSVVVPALQQWSFEIFSNPVFCSSVKFWVWGQGKRGYWGQVRRPSFCAGIDWHNEQVNAVLLLISFSADT